MVIDVPTNVEQLRIVEDGQHVGNWLTLWETGDQMALLNFLKPKNQVKKATSAPVQRDAGSLKNVELSKTFR